MVRSRHRIETALLAVALLCASVRVEAATKESDARLLALRGQVLEDQGAHEAAMAAFTQAIALNVLPAAEQARLFYARGVIQDVQGGTLGALNDYSAAIMLSPDFAPALNNRANLYRRQNRLDAARRDYLASLAADNPEPEFPGVGLGEIAEVQGDSAAARQDYARAVAANPAYRPARDRLAAVGGQTPSVPDPVHLRPPPKAMPDMAQTAPAGAMGARAEIAPARYEPPDPPALRPALDNSPVRAPQVQLGAWRSEEEAGDAWNRAVQQADGLLGGLRPHIVAADLSGKGLYYRLRVAPSGETPVQLCETLMARGLACVPAHD